MVYADDVIILGRSLCTIEKNMEAFLVASKESGLEANADKAKYMFTSQDQNAGQSHNMKIDNSSVGGAEEF